MADETAKMNAAKQLAEQGGTQPTIMDQYMGKIAQAENPLPEQPMQQMQQPMQQMQQPMPQQMAPEDVGIASQATAPMQMAGGGIIAFGDGGDVADEEDMALEMARDDADMNMGSSVGDIYKMARHGIKNLMSNLPQSYEATKAKVSQAMPESKSGSHPLETKAIGGTCGVGMQYTRVSKTYISANTGTIIQNKTSLIESLHITVSKYEVFVIQNMSKWIPQPILEPMEIELHLKKRTEDNSTKLLSLHIEIDNFNAQVSFTNI
jgi:hypothetical protein